MKHFEQFTNDSYEMQSILDKLEKRISYWFQDGEFSMRSNLVDSSSPTSTTSSKRSIVINFSDDEFYYQMILRMNIDDLEKCDVIIKKYDPSQIDLNGGGKPINILELTNDKRVKINDIKEDFIIKKLSEIEDMDKNPDKNKIEPPQQPQQPQQPSAPPAGGELGGSPPPMSGSETGEAPMML